jgi:hypothetical protein
MKRTLLIGVVMLMAFAAVFIGCESAYELKLTQTDTIPSLSGPNNLKATPYPGVNLITWDFHKDAKSYSVFRKYTDTGIVTPLGDIDPGVTSYEDIVSFSNQLIHGKNYEYTVTVNSGQSTSLRTVDSDAVIFDGASSVSVTADIPARNVATASSPVKALTDATLTVGKWVDHNSSEKLEVYWTVEDGNFSEYKVEYLYGDGTLPVSSSSTLTASGTPLTRATAPLIGGPTAVKVTAYWKEDYYSPAPLTKTYTGVPTTLPQVTGFNVTNTTGNVYTLTWTDVIGATDYDVWKAPVTIGTVNGGESSISSSWTLGAWTQVTTTAKTKNATTYTLLETSVDISKAYVYIILAKNTTAKSSSPAIKATKVITPTDTTTDDFTAAPTTAPGGTPQITISWTKAVDETYVLSRAEVTYDPDGNTILSIGPYTTVSVPADQPSEVIVIDTPTVRHSYMYNLKVTKTNGSVRNVTQPVKTAPYSSLNVSASISASPSSTSVYSTDVTVNVSGAGPYTADLSAEIFQATYDNRTSTENSTWTSKGKLTAAQLGAGTGLTVSGLTPDQYYVYQAKITSGTGTTTVVLKNTDSSYRVNPSYGSTLTSYYNPTVSASSTKNASTGIALILDSGVNDTLSLLKDAKVSVKRWDGTTNKYIYTTLPNVVQYTSTAISGTATVAAVPAKSYYISFTADTIPLPPTAAAGQYHYYLVTPNNQGRDDSNGSGFTEWGSGINTFFTFVTGNPITSRTVRIDPETITW